MVKSGVVSEGRQSVCGVGPPVVANASGDSAQKHENRVFRLEVTPMVSIPGHHLFSRQRSIMFAVVRENYYFSISYFVFIFAAVRDGWWLEHYLLCLAGIADKGFGAI